jgi:hypothetical protein
VTAPGPAENAVPAAADSAPAAGTAPKPPSRTRKPPRALRVAPADAPAAEASPEPPQQQEFAPLPEGWWRTHPAIGAPLYAQLPDLARSLPDPMALLLAIAQQTSAQGDASQAEDHRLYTGCRKETIGKADSAHEVVHKGWHLDGDVCWYEAAYQNAGRPLMPLWEPAGVAG